MSDELVAAVPLIVGLVEVAKRCGYPDRHAPLLAVALGVAAAASWLLVAGPVDARATVLAVWNGIALGLAAVGLYHVSGAVGRGTGNGDSP